MSKDSLLARAGNVAKEDAISNNVVYLRYFFDYFLKRLSASSYEDMFVLKD